MATTGLATVAETPGTYHIGAVVHHCDVWLIVEILSNLSHS